MEHNVYVCKWSRSPKGCVLWVKSRPHLRGEGADYDEAEKRLIDAIQDAGGAMQAVFEFDPPLPKTAPAEEYTTPEILLVVGDDGFEVDAPSAHAFETKEEMWVRRRWAAEFYDSPICPKCRYVVGRRTEKPLSIKGPSSGYDGAFGRIGDARSNHQILSQEFIALLTLDEQRNLDLRPVVRLGGRRKFYELVGPQGPPLVAVAGMQLSGWRCDQCDHRTWGYWEKDLGIHDFVARSDVPAAASVFAIGVFPEIQLAVGASRWKEMVGRKGTRGFTSQPLGLVPDDEVVRRPDLPTAKEQVEERNRRSQSLGLPPSR